MNSSAQRRRFAFTLRAMLVAIAVLAVPGGWVVAQLHWVTQRHAARERVQRDVEAWQTKMIAAGIKRDPRVMSCEGVSRVKPSPWLWRMLGDRAEHSIRYSPDYTVEEIDHLRKLFPEAYINQKHW